MLSLCISCQQRGSALYLSWQETGLLSRQIRQFRGSRAKHDGRDKYKLCVWNIKRLTHVRKRCPQVSLPWTRCSPCVLVFGTFSTIIIVRLKYISTGTKKGLLITVSRLKISNKIPDCTEITSFETTKLPVEPKLC